MLAQITEAFRGQPIQEAEHYEHLRAIEGLALGEGRGGATEEKVVDDLLLGNFSSSAEEDEQEEQLHQRLRLLNDEDIEEEVALNGGVIGTAGGSRSSHAASATCRRFWGAVARNHSGFPNPSWSRQ